MSDPGRKDISSHIEDTVEPHFLKSSPHKAQEHATDAADRVTRDSQPDSSKGGFQATFDKVERAKDHALHGTSHTGTHGTNVITGTTDNAKHGVSDAAHNLSHDTKVAAHDAADPGSTSPHRKSIGEKVKEALHLGKSQNTFDTTGKSHHTAT